MAEFDTKTYYLAKTKFIWLIIPIVYFAYINVFTADTADESQVLMWSIFFITVGAMSYITNLVYDHYFRDITSITIDEDGVSTMSADKSTNHIDYENLMGPEISNLGIIKRFTFRSSSRMTQQIIFTTLTDNADELLEELKKRMIASNEERDNTTSDDEEDA